MPSSLQEGISAAKAGKMQAALDHLKNAIIEEPQNADVWVWIAAIIDDDTKQEVFLKNALEIDPNNIPAQRGLAYLQKRREQPNRFENSHLTDHTQPISPFPASGKPKTPSTSSEWQKENPDVTSIPEKEPTGPIEPLQPDKPIQKLSLLELSLLGVVVVVFFFIGLLAASALFNFDLPLAFLNSNRPMLSSDPPHTGVFLYESAIFFELQEHQGLPREESGIPNSLGNDPQIVYWQKEIDLNKLRLIYETGEYLAFEVNSDQDKATIVRPQPELLPGLYCLQEWTELQTIEDARYWCFRVTTANPD